MTVLVQFLAKLYLGWGVEQDSLPWELGIL